MSLGAIGARSVADAMVRAPKVTHPRTTVAQARALFDDRHMHAVLIVEGTALLAVVERADVEGAAEGDALAWPAGRLDGRIVAPDADLGTVTAAMAARGQRRLAVVGGAGELLGLLCRKRSGRGFCSDTDVRARAADQCGCC